MLSQSEITLLASVCVFVAVMLAAPLPIAMTRVAWPSRRPALALLVWQIIGLVGGVSMILGLFLLCLAVWPEHPWLTAIPAFVLGAYLLVHLVITMVRAARRRRRLHELVALLTEPHPFRARTRVIEDTTPIAYCLPGGEASTIVLSSGLVEQLTPEQLQAVVAHERAHVEQRHDLLQLVFGAWRSALPWFPVAVIAEREVSVLVELLADDRARREVHDEVLAHALLASVGSAPGTPGLQMNTRQTRASPEASRTAVAPIGSKRTSDRFTRLQHSGG